LTVSCPTLTLPIVLAADDACGTSAGVASIIAINNDVMLSSLR
jgi:hypothetical protein